MGGQSQLESTRAFWDANPCGVEAEYELQRAQRYAMEPWVPGLLARVAENHRSVLEVGCGQGVDSIQLCIGLQPGSSYVGVDYSPVSVDRARANAKGLANLLRVTPDYLVGNAESLQFNDASFDAVYSMGVLHHTANELAAVKEIHRVLRDGGKAYVCLYRRPAPKVAIAKLLRALQRGFDFLLGTDRYFYELLRRKGTSNPLFGTMFHECFGVPYLKWYVRREIAALFSDFSRIELITIGANLGRLLPSAKPSIFGYFWQIEATK